MTNQQGAPEALPDPSPDQLRAIARTARNSSGSASDDCGPLAYVLYGWRAAAIAFRAHQAALVEAQQPATHVQEPAGIEHVAGDVSKNGPESNMAQQPAPSAASKAVLAAIRAANMQLVRTGDDEFMLVTYKNAKAQCDGGKCGIGGYCDDCPMPQADSQPAPKGETNVQLDIDSNHSTPEQQRDVAGSVALGQPVGNRTDQAASHLGTQGNKLLTVAERNIRSFLRSASFKSESDREAALNCVDVLWAAARAPADSVTAPAATPAAASIAWNALRDATDPLGETGTRIMGLVRVFAQRQYEAGLTKGRATPPAQAAGSAREDADPLQGAANWLAEAHGQFCVAVLQGCLMIGYNRAKRLHDAAIAARKQGGA